MTRQEALARLRAQIDAGSPIIGAGAGTGATAGAGAEATAGAAQTVRETPVLSVAVVITWPAGQLVAGGAAFAIALLPPSRQLAGNLFDSSACPAPA